MKDDHKHELFANGLELILPEEAKLWIHHARRGDYSPYYSGKYIPMLERNAAFARWLTDEATPNIRDAAAALHRQIYFEG